MIKRSRYKIDLIETYGGKRLYHYNEADFFI